MLGKGMAISYGCGVECKQEHQRRSMHMPGSIRLGKIAGIDIYIHVSWLIIVVLLTWSLDIQFSASYPGWGTATYWVVSLIATLLLFAAVLLHELAHSVVARARGLSVKNITDRKSTRLNSSHTVISYAVFCLKKKKKNK